MKTQQKGWKERGVTKNSYACLKGEIFVALKNLNIFSESGK
jgi:hypothetical protein